VSFLVVLQHRGDIDHFDVIQHRIRTKCGGHGSVTSANG
jgi:hypothetical protein